MATTSITPDMETNVTGVERAEEQRFQHARDCEGNHDSDNHTKQRHASALHHDHPSHGRAALKMCNRTTYRDIGQRQFAMLVKAANVKAITFTACATPARLSCSRPANRCTSCRDDWAMPAWKSRSTRTRTSCRRCRNRPPPRWERSSTVSNPLANRTAFREFSEGFGVGVDDGVRTRDFRSHSPALYR